MLFHQMQLPAAKIEVDKIIENSKVSCKTLTIRWMILKTLGVERIVNSEWVCCIYQHISYYTPSFKIL